MFNFQARAEAQKKVPNLPRLAIGGNQENDGELTIVLKERRAKIYFSKGTNEIRMSKTQALELAEFIQKNYTGEVEEPKDFGGDEDEKD